MPYDWESRRIVSRASSPSSNQLLAPLTTRCRRSSKQASLTLSESFLQKLVNKLVVQHRVRVVHPHGIGAIVIHDILMRYPFAKVGLIMSK